jgi:uncharacterized membrane protein
MGPDKPTDAEYTEANGSTGTLTDGSQNVAPPIPAEIQKLDPKTRQVVEAYAFSFHSGPLPPAKLLQQYEQVCPGAARDIVDMAKAEQANRHHCNRVEASAITRGQIFGVLSFALAMVATGFLAYMGAPVAAGTMGTAAISVFGGAYLLSRHKSAPKEPERTKPPQPPKRRPKGRR